MSVTLEARIDSFIAEHSLGKTIKEELCSLVSGCFEDLFKHLMNVPFPETTVSKKPAAVAKAEKIEDVSSVESLDQLRNCTTASLSQYCKENELKVGGNKKDIMDRIWRHLQGSGSEEDKGRLSKPKKVKTKEPVEKHECCGSNAAGHPCAIGGQELFGNHWFCWRHINHAADIIEKMDSVAVPAQVPTASVKKAKAEPKKKAAWADASSSSGSGSEPEPEPEIQPEPEIEKPKKIKKKIVKKDELVSE